MGPHRIAIAAGANQPQAQPVVFLAGIVVQEQRGFSIAGYQNIEPAVVIIISQSQAASREVAGEGGTCLCRNVAKLLVLLTEEEHWLLISNFGHIDLDHVVWMSVGQQQVQLSVIVKVEKFQSPAAQ